MDCRTNTIRPAVTGWPHDLDWWIDVVLSIELSDEFTRSDRRYWLRHIRKLKEEKQE
jgi:hypothetical protein